MSKQELRQKKREIKDLRDASLQEAKERGLLLEELNNSLHLVAVLREDLAKCREELADEKTLVPWGLRCVNCGHVVVETTPDSLVGSLGVDMEAFEESLPLESEDEGVA